MSSHREAPEISKDPVADSTDLYAFVSPDNPDTVTIIANYIPLQAPAGGPNFYEFGPDVLYEIHIDSTGDGYPNISYQFRFTTTVATPGTFLYNTGPISSLTDPNWSRRQTYSVTKVVGYPGMTSKELAARSADARRATSGRGRRRTTAALAARRHHHAEDRRDRVRRPAGGGLLRRPRVHLRPRRPPAALGRPSDPGHGHSGREPADLLQCPHHRHPGPDQRPHRRRVDPDRRRRSPRRDRGVDLGQPPSSVTSTPPPATGSPSGRGSRSPGSATPSSTRS